MQLFIFIAFYGVAFLGLTLLVYLGKISTRLPQDYDISAEFSKFQESILGKVGHETEREEFFSVKSKANPCELLYEADRRE